MSPFIEEKVESKSITFETQLCFYFNYKRPKIDGLLIIFSFSLVAECKEMSTIESKKSQNAKIEKEERKNMNGIKKLFFTYN